MKKHVDDAAAKTPPNHPAAPRAEEPEGVGALTGRLISGARARAEAERREAAPRGAVTRALLALTLMLVTAAAATFAYGIYNFPDAPIRPRGTGYVGRTGRPHARGDYERYLDWGLAMWAVFPAAFIAGAAFGYFEARDRRRGRRPRGAASTDARG